MIFSSHVFMFVFLPIVLAIFFMLRQTGRGSGAALWLILASLAFYTWWRPSHLILLLISLAANFVCARAILGALDRNPVRAKWLTLAGIMANLGALFYFKYFVFVFENLAGLFGSEQTLARIILPLGISFVTFEQCMFLADVYRRNVRKVNLETYALFITFFPHLIAGPIVLYREFEPQTRKVRDRRRWTSDLAIGLSAFAIGLFKKVAIADQLAMVVDSVYGVAAGGMAPSAGDAWAATFAFSMQVYFDFSGYADMAIGLARMMGIDLPANFNSPYKARNIIDLWRNWHMTLTRLITAEIFTPLSVWASRMKFVRSGSALTAFLGGAFVPALISFLIVGIWHGAGWTFIFFGLLHGFYVGANFGWQAIRRRRFKGLPNLPIYQGACWMATFLAFTVSLVLFRSTDLQGAAAMYRGMLGLSGAVSFSILPTPGLIEVALPSLVRPETTLIVVLLLTCWTVFAPNTHEIMARFQSLPNLRIALPAKLWWQWRPSGGWAFVLAGLAGFAILLLDEPHAFIYFQF